MKLLIPAIMLSMMGSALAADPTMPDAKMTPGAWHYPATPLDILCVKGYSKSVHSTIPKEIKEAVLQKYGYDPAYRGVIIDRLVPTELDGTDDVTNLWPESPTIAIDKVTVENELKHLVCKHKVDLRTAQLNISLNWKLAYKKYILHQINEIPGDIDVVTIAPHTAGNTGAGEQHPQVLNPSGAKPMPLPSATNPGEDKF